MTASEPIHTIRAYWCKPHSPKIGIGTLKSQKQDDGSWVGVCPLRGERTRCDIVKVVLAVTESEWTA